MAARFTITRLLLHGSALALLGCLQTACALQWDHIPAAAVGAVGLASGIALLLTAASQYAQGAEACRTRKSPGSPLPAAMLPRWAASTLTALTTWLVLLVLVHIASPDPRVQAFPTTCQPKLLGCSRVAVQQPHRAAGLTPLELTTTLPAAADAAKAWLRRQPRTALLLDSSSPSSAGDGSNTAADGSVFLHARVVTLLWGFADDFFIRLTSEPGSSRVRVEQQGQLRLGVGDMEVNVQRNVAFSHAMKQQFAENDS